LDKVDETLLANTN